jgi:hydroxypyruvate reductase
MLSRVARKIFEETLLRVDSQDAVRRAVKIENAKLSIFENQFELSDCPSIYVAAIGKAAYPMAVGFSEVAGELVRSGVVSGVVAENELDEKWQVFRGGHPLPNEESLASARACLELLKKADGERALVIFLISGGGSAMMDLPRSDKITLADLREFNQILVTCGAAIAEMNAVRRAISRVKGGGLALSAPNAEQISLIISDTSKGDISSVASGPSLLPAKDIPDALRVLEKYDLKSKLPSSVISLLEEKKPEVLEKGLETRAYVLLDTEYMIRQAAQIAEKMGFVVKTDDNPDDDPIAEGCEKLFSRFIEFRKTVSENRPICFISGGEFGCKVFGNGIGGRNCETVLRLALLARNETSISNYAILSAGTDGLDGNSPSAGAIADQTTFERAGRLKMNPREYLQNSDSFSFFDRLNDSIITGATGTNVRDIRILLAE